MSEPMSLEDVLSGEPVVEEEATETVEAVEEHLESSIEEAVEEPEATEEPTGVEETEPPSVEATKEVPLAAMLDERDKRKALQAELDAIRAEQSKNSEQKVDFWENPEAAIDSVREGLRNEFQQQRVTDRLEFSMQLAKNSHDDYDSGLEAFKVAAEQNPALVDQAIQSEHPGEYIYKVGKQFAELDSMGGDLDAMRTQIRNEERSRLMEEMKGKENKLASVPTPLTDETSAMAPRETVQGGATPLSNIFKHNSG